MKSIAFFNNKGGVGKTTFTYHLGFALENQGKKVLFVDADPQCNLSSHLCPDKVILNAWADDGQSLYKAVAPIIKGAGDVEIIDPYKLPDRNIWIFIGDLLLSDFEEELSGSWVQILAGQERGFRVTSSLYRLIREFSEKNGIDYILIDLGPNMGALNRSLLLSCDNFIIPMIPDMFSLRGSQNIGRIFAKWILDYQLSKERVGELDFEIPIGAPKFSGYILQQFNVYRRRKTKAYEQWGNQIPINIEDFVIGPLSDKKLEKYDAVLPLEDYKIADFKNYHGLIPRAQEALKPVFELTAADGVVGGHVKYVEACREEFDDISKYFIKVIK